MGFCKTESAKVVLVISNCLVSSCPISSCLVSSYLVSSYLSRTCLVSTCLASTCLISSCPISSCLISSCPIRSCLMLLLDVVEGLQVCLHAPALPLQSPSPNAFNLTSPVYTSNMLFSRHSVGPCIPHCCHCWSPTSSPTQHVWDSSTRRFQYTSCRGVPDMLGKCALLVGL